MRIVLHCSATLSIVWGIAFGTTASASHANRGAAPEPAVTTTPADPETPQQHDARMKWWREARFGMFIHWGLYAVPAGVWKGKKIPGIGEWIMHHARIPVDEYAALAKQFNPVKFDADAWVRLAKEAGMKYIVITSKHHDGFAMFDSDVSEFNIHDATPFHRDPIAELKQACDRHGIRLGLYYSQAQDWHHPGGAAAGGHWDPKQDGDFDKYLDAIAAPQVREILAKYQPAILWWDTPVNMTRERALRLLPLVRLRPGIIMNNRLGGGIRGDFATPEQHIPPTGLSYDWETCMTMNGTWGYKSLDNNWKSTETLIHNLVDIASKGGNYLLNVGPTAEGVIPEPSVKRLKEIGRWMRVNGESIYNTTASVFRKAFPWGRCTVRHGIPITTLYLHVFSWPADRRIELPGLTRPVTAVRFLAAPDALVKADVTAEATIVTLPETPPDPVDSVIRLDIRGPVGTIVFPTVQKADGTLLVHARDAMIHGQNARYEQDKRRGLDNIGFWTASSDWVEWPVRIVRPGEYEIVFTVATPSDNVDVIVQVGPETIAGKVRKTGSYTTFREQVMGRVRIGSPGRLPIAVRCGPHWSPINLRSVLLRPVRD